MWPSEWRIKIHYLVHCIRYLKPVNTDKMTGVTCMYVHIYIEYFEYGDLDMGSLTLDQRMVSILYDPCVSHS